MGKAALYLLGVGAVMAAMFVPAFLASRTAKGGPPPATYTVIEPGDGGDWNIGDGFCDTSLIPLGSQCTLRAAIQEANFDAAKNTINFALGGVGPHTISPASPFDAITQPVIIDGYSQSLATENTLAAGTDAQLKIVINGAGAGGDGLVINAGNTEVRGLVIRSFSGSGIHITGPGGNVIEGNFIGTGADGVTDQGNGLQGVYIEKSSGNRVGGTNAEARNLISGNEAAGVYVSGSGDPASASENVIQGNLVGTDRTGILDRGNRAGGIDILEGIGNFVGGNTGTTPGGACTGACNLVSGGGETGGDQGLGITVFGENASENVVQGNFVGTNVSGTGIIPNRGRGISLGNAAPNNIIGGSAAGAGNLVSGNQLGMDITGDGNTVQGNLFGTDTTGTQIISNDFEGILLRASNNQIGGPEPGAGNVFAGSTIGIQIASSVPSASGNLVQGNFIGVGKNGGQIGVDTDGIIVGNNAVGNIIGGAGPGEGNTIAYNLQNGISVLSGATGNAIRGNSIHDNGGLGIDLGDDGVTANDAGDGDSGGNLQQNYAVVSDAHTGSVIVEGSLDGAPSETFHIDVFANALCDPSGYGEGHAYLGSFDVQSDAAGNVSFSGSVSGEAVLASAITTTATDSNGNTSEFSACAVLGEGPTPTPTPTPGPSGTPTGTPTPTGSPGGLVQGDVDCNNVVNSVDALKILRFVAQLSVAQEPGCPAIGSEVASLFGDVDCGGAVTSVDALKVLRFVAELSVAQSEPCADIDEPL